jgi:hypothetical protein
MGFLIRSLGCFLLLVLFPLAIPILLFYVAFKLLSFALREAEVTQSNARAGRSRGFLSDLEANRSGFFDNLFGHSEPAKRKMKRHAQQLAAEICEALDYNQRIPAEKKRFLIEQARQLTDHSLNSLEKVARIQRRKSIVNPNRRLELEGIERRLLAEVRRSMDILEDALVSIITVDVVGENTRIDRLVSELYESNARLRDIADAHQEIKTVRGVWVGK